MKRTLLTICILSLSTTQIAYAQQAMSSSVYKIQSDSVNIAGARSESGSYALQDTAGELVSGVSSSTNYTGLQGYEFMQLDIVPPGITPSLSATPLSTDEIELAWGEAFDDYGIDRYYIYRDGVKVNDVASFPRDYVDSGLSANTQYVYRVSAVDAAGNEGPLSDPVTARTFSGSIPGGAPTPGILGSSVIHWSVSASDESAVISFVTTTTLKAELLWGKDASYADGHLSQGFADLHTFLLEHLSPGTLYMVKVLLRDGYDHVTTYYMTFRTANIALSARPANVTNFTATMSPSTSGRQASVDLAWKLPIDKRVVGVRIVRREDFYPTSPEDGEKIFENKDASGVESFADANVRQDGTYFYAIFTVDLAGNYSSGVLAQVGTSPLENLAAAGVVDPKIGKLSLNDFLFIQNGDSLPVKDGLVSVVGNENLTVALRAYHLPPVLKTIAVSMVTADYKRFTFILRPNTDHTRYEATVASLGDPTVYKLKLDILDYANHGLKSLKGTIAVKLGEIKLFLLDEKSKKFFGYGIAVVLVAGLYVWFTRRKYKELTIIEEEPWTALVGKMSKAQMSND
ncbi:fibronectin type III domain-containing protein [Candidatus Parcubacteria bacterium]|nr:fibronectin type III domain-containing protein [Candidatus Parcubacteria bacterium]